MKIINKGEFLKLPEGTLYCEYEPCTVSRPLIKGESLMVSNDYCESEITDIYFDSTGDMFDKYGEMEKEGKSYPLELHCYGRNGMFNDKQLFIIYEKIDIELLINKLTECLEVSK